MTETTTIGHIIAARSRTLDGHPIRRVLPTRHRKMVGPFIFFDHIGPEVLPPGRGVDVPPHPHIHLATVTYLFDGELVHRDSVGSVQPIRPGDINWMHAGRGIVHSERSGETARREESRIHGIQLWVALPRNQEETDPAFAHYPAEALPAWTANGVRSRLLVGATGGRTSPVKTRSRVLYMDLEMEQGASSPLPEDATPLSVYVAGGSVTLDGQPLAESMMAVRRRGPTGTLWTKERARVLVLGGDPLDGERHIWWNFVSSSVGRIERAKRDWQDRRFPTVPADEGYTALPE